MAENIPTMAVQLEELVAELNAEHRLKWPNATNEANYYEESSSNGFYDGIASCLDVLADIHEWAKSEGGDAAFFLREAANTLWQLEGASRRWKDAENLHKAAALLHLVTALEIESRRIPKEHAAPADA